MSAAHSDDAAARKARADAIRQARDERNARIDSDAPLDDAEPSDAGEPNYVDLVDQAMKKDKRLNP